jgi:uncharacterized protein YoxC
MSGLFSPAPLLAATLRIQAGSQEVDTVLAIPVRDGFDVVIAVAAALVGLAFLGLLLTLLLVLLQIRKVSRAVDEARKRVSTDRGVEHLRNTARHLEEISATFRDEVGKLSGSVTHLSDRLTQASDRMEERIEEFNALMEVIQAEAENAFVDTASAARGVRRGVGHLADPPRDTRTADRGRDPSTDGRSGTRQAPPAPIPGADPEPEDS